MLAGCGKKPEQGSAAPADASAPNGNAQDPQEGQSSAGNPDDSSEASVGDSGIPYEPIAEDGDLKMPATPVVPPANSGKIHVFTLSLFRHWRAIFPKKLSTRFSQEECVGVKVN